MQSFRMQTNLPNPPTPFYLLRVCLDPRPGGRGWRGPVPPRHSKLIFSNRMSWIDSPKERGWKWKSQLLSVKQEGKFCYFTATMFTMDSFSGGTISVSFEGKRSLPLYLVSRTRVSFFCMQISRHLPTWRFVSYLHPWEVGSSLERDCVQPSFRVSFLYTRSSWTFGRIFDVAYPTLI